MPSRHCRSRPPRVQAYLNDGDLEFLRGLGSEVGRRTADILEAYAKFHANATANRNLVMHDANGRL